MNTSQFRSSPWKLFFITLLGMTAIRAFYSGLYIPISSLLHEHAFSRQVWVEIAPLIDLIKNGVPISLDSNPRQYGPVFLFLMYPCARFMQNTFDNFQSLEFVSLIYVYIFLAAGFYVTYRTLFGAFQFSGKKIALLACAAVWFNFSSLYYIIHVKNVEIWELFLISVFAYAYLRKQGWLAGFSVAAASLIKLLPAIFFIFLLIKDRKTLLKTMICFLAILAAAHFSFGPDMGFLYFPKVLASGLGRNSWATTHMENNSIKGVIFKFFSGFRYSMPNYEVFRITLEEAKAAFNIATAAVYGVFAFCCWILWRNPKNASSEQSLDEIGLVCATMMLVSPVSALEYSTLLLFSFSSGLAALLFSANKPRFRLTQIFFFSSAYLLLGHFLPMSILLGFPLFDWVRVQAGLVDFDIGESYKALGFPLLGYLCFFSFFAIRAFAWQPWKRSLVPASNLRSQ